LTSSSMQSPQKIMANLKEKRRPSVDQNDKVAGS
jgi:hypothetical protein